MNSLFFLSIVIMISLCAPALGLTCSNVKIQATGASLDDKITCDYISAFEVSPEISFLNIRQEGNDILLSGNIYGIDKTGWVRIYDKQKPSTGDQVTVLTAMRIPVVINQGSTPTPTPTPTREAPSGPAVRQGSTPPTPMPTVSAGQGPGGGGMPIAHLVVPATEPTPTFPIIVVLGGLFVASIGILIYAWKRW